MIKVLLALILYLFSTNTYASGEKLCRHLFSSHSETSLRLSGVVFNPADSLRPTTNSLAVTTWKEDESWKTDRTALRDYDEDYIGFLVHPDYHRQYVLAQTYYEGLQIFAKSFTKRSTPEEIQQIVDSDNRNFWNFLQNGRMGYALVASEGNFNGFMRVLDCTDYNKTNPRKIHVEQEGEKNYLSPTEVTARKQGHDIPFYQDMRDQGYMIFQIGKFSINAEMTPEDRLKTKKLLLTWLKNNYLDSSRLNFEKVIFVFNVDSAVHKRRYERDFGAVEVDREKNYAHWPDNESLLYVDIKTLFEKLNLFEADF